MISDNPYLDHLLEIVQPDGSYHYLKNVAAGTNETHGFDSVDRVIQIALVLEIFRLREILDEVVDRWKR